MWGCRPEVAFSLEGFSRLCLFLAITSSLIDNDVPRAVTTTTAVHCANEAAGAVSDYGVVEAVGRVPGKAD